MSDLVKRLSRELRNLPYDLDEDILRDCLTQAKDRITALEAEIKLLRSELLTRAKLKGDG